MSEKFEKLATLFLAVFAPCLALVMAADGLEPRQSIGAITAAAGSLSLALLVRLWPKPEPVKARARRD